MKRAGEDVKVTLFQYTLRRVRCPLTIHEKKMNEELLEIVLKLPNA